MFLTQPIAGVDVSKDTLEVYLLPSGRSLRVQNKKGDIRKLVKNFKQEKVALVVMEPTSRYHWELMLQMVEGGVPIAVINPKKVRDFANPKFQGQN